MYFHVQAVGGDFNDAELGKTAKFNSIVVQIGATKIGERILSIKQ